MRFRRGSYALLVSKACFPRLALVLEDLRLLETPATHFARSLQLLKAEISRGADSPDLAPFGAAGDEFTITLHGYRIRLRIDQRIFTIQVADVDRP